MLIDTTLLMYSAFQSCRHALRHTSTALNLLAETLEFVKQQGTLVAEAPDKWVEENAMQSIVVVPSAEPDQADLLSAANQALFSLIYVGTSDYGPSSLNLRFAVSAMPFPCFHPYSEPQTNLVPGSICVALGMLGAIGTSFHLRCAEHSVMYSVLTWLT
jgi:hypothetical protein